MDRNLITEYDRISRVSVDTLIQDMYNAIEKLEEELTSLEKEKDSIVSDLQDQINDLEVENAHLKNEIDELKSENACLLSPNRPVDLFQL